MGDFASSLKKVEKKTSAKDKVIGFFLNRKDECLQKTNYKKSRGG